MWYIQVCLAYLTIAHALLQKHIFMVHSHYKSCVFPYGTLVHTRTKYITSTHVHSLYKQNSPLSRLDFLFSEALVKTFNINAEKTKFYSSRLVYFTLADLLQTKTVQEAEFRDCHWCISIHFASFYFDEK